MKPHDRLFVVVGTVAIMGAAVAGGLALFVGGSDVTSHAIPVSSSQTQSPGSSSTNGSTSTTGSYKDGTYTATGYYMVPHGDTNSVKTTLKVSGGKITSVSTMNNTQDSESEMYISSFKQYVESEVVGQSLNGYYGSRIGGASLTTDGFNQTLDTIRRDAAA